MQATDLEKKTVKKLHELAYSDKKIVNNVHELTLELARLQEELLNEKIVVQEIPTKLQQIIISIKYVEFSLLKVQKKTKILRYLKRASSLFAAVGGFLVALNITQSRWGFLLLFLSSSQLLIASIKEGDREMIIYSSSLFIFVDSVGVYRWILT